jgi:membrane protease subunit (stomatin/prohibitin family)
MHQSTLFRGIYEFEDPSGTLMAAKIPLSGSVDLYQDTVLIVRPNQCCLFLYKGQIADIFMDGTHRLNTENIPVLTQLSNLKLGFRNPLRAELWFFSGQAFTARRWGTPAPVLVKMEKLGAVPIGMFGQYSLALRDPEKFFRTLVGTRSTYDITEAEEFIQGQIQEMAPQALVGLKNLEDLANQQESVSNKLMALVEPKLKELGLKILELQVHGISPGQEVLKAMEAKVAMETIGDPRTYLLYQAAQSLNQPGGGSGNTTANDPMQMMLGLMLGKNLVNENTGPNQGRVPEPLPAQIETANCRSCGGSVNKSQKFCGHCGAKL